MGVRRRIGESLSQLHQAAKRLLTMFAQDANPEQIEHADQAHIDATARDLLDGLDI
jgi:hypothetical protein